MSGRSLTPAAEQAIAWMVRLSSGRGDARQQVLFQQWLAQDPANAQAWEQLQQGLGGHYEVLRRAPATLRDALLQPELGRRELLRGLVGVGVFGGGLWLAGRSEGGRAMLADMRTGTAERRRLQLGDGSELILNAGSAADFAMADGRRLLRLYSGAVVVQVAADRARPFIVRSAQGEVQALGTRFLVEQLAHSTRVVVLEHAVRASLPDGASLDVQQGQAVCLHETRIEPLGADQAYRSDWIDGRLSVLDEPLDAVIQALRPYRSGFIRVSPDVRQLRVQGVFPLDDSERTLMALAQTLPIRVEHYGPWLTLIEAR
jgi:transmembrane sensor